MGLFSQLLCGGYESILLSCCFYYLLVVSATSGEVLQEKFSNNALHAVANSRRRVKRIIGGERVDIKTVPYMLSLRLDGGHICGAVIIGTEWSLTAAHCCITPINLTLQSGTSTLENGDGESHRVTQLIRHELYRQNDDDYDLCALRVEPSFVYSDVTAPAKLPTRSVEKREVTNLHFSGGSVCGWGYTEADGNTLSPRLRLINVSRVDLETCKYAYRSLYTIHDDDVCYGSKNGFEDACQGDSGGPLISQESGELVGIVSFGDECGYSKLPGVYVDVMQFRRWIKKTTGL